MTACPTTNEVQCIQNMHGTPAVAYCGDWDKAAYFVCDIQLLLSKMSNVGVNVPFIICYENLRVILKLYYIITVVKDRLPSKSDDYSNKISGN